MQEGRAARPFQAPQTGFSKLIAGHHDWEDGEELQLCKTEIKSLVKKSFILLTFRCFRCSLNVAKGSVEKYLLFELVDFFIKWVGRVSRIH